MSSKVALISGAAGYLGKEVARKFDLEGYKLILLYHNNIPEVLSNSKAYKCDFGNINEIKTTVSSIEKDFGQIEVYVHCAEYKIARVPLSDLSEEEYEKTINTSILGFLIFIKEISRITEEGGHIFGITSSVIANPSSNMGLYVVCKNAQRSILNVFKKELEPRVHVHEISPAFMPGGLNADLPNAYVEILRNRKEPVSTPEGVAEEIINFLKNGI